MIDRPWRSMPRLLTGFFGCVALLAGCGGGREPTTGGTKVDAPLAQAAVCDGADLAALMTRVHVSSKGTDTDACGATTGTACRTIQRGINACPIGSGCGVLVRHGLYPTTDTIHLKTGVSIFGSCRFNGEPARGYRTTIQASPPPGGPAISASDINVPTVVHGLVVVGKDESSNGFPSIAVAVLRSRGLTFTQSVLSSGHGGAGAGGATTSAAGGPGANGAQGVWGGAQGGDSCPSHKVSSDGNGGAGGTDRTQEDNGNCTTYDDGKNGNSSGSVIGGLLGTKGAAGLWCNGRPHDAPGEGGIGGTGANGSCGRPARASALAAGSFDGTTWKASMGDNGVAGAVGSGGGGGGAGGACCSSGFCHAGLSGGGGGGGGCGGGAGGGGQQGGASIPVVAVDFSAVLLLADNTVVPGPGGNGGDAGNASGGGSGGAGGPGQTQGQSLFWGHYCGGIGKAGGPGGWGGSGSGGAGGNGGPSIGIARVSNSVAPIDPATIYATQPGAPGYSGNGGFLPGSTPGCIGASGEAGKPGIGAPIVEFAGTGAAAAVGRQSARGAVGQTP
ncbi:MAG: hypothetical protein V4684_19040 [Pseudomonadota bacterium]